MNYEARVKAGARLLDEHHPVWAEKVNTAELQMNSECQCVLGQLYGYFGRGLCRLGIDDGDARIDFGFNTNYLDQSDARDYHAELAELESLWLAEINARLTTNPEA